MIRRHENSVSFKAGALSIGVHAALLIALLISVNWKTTHTISIAEVELWDSLPSPQVQKPLPPPPEPKIEPPPKPEPPKVKKIEPPPEPKIAPKADITIKKIEKKLEKKVEKPKEIKKPDALAALQKQLMQDELEKNKKQKKDDALRKLQQEALADERAESDQQAKASKSAASAGEVDKYKAQIQRKIQHNVNKSLCGSGKPELVFEIIVMPSGDVQGTKLVKSSGVNACDDAVERAILQSVPLPMPTDASLRAEFRNLELKFRPNE